MRYVFIGLMAIVIWVESAFAGDGTLKELSVTQSFFAGVAGAFVIYLVMYRETRIAEFAKHPGESWNVVFIDIFGFLLAGGLVAMLTLTLPSGAEAFMAGAAWQGLAGGFASGTENSKLRDIVDAKNKQLTTVLKKFRQLGLQQPDPADDVQEVPPQGEV